MKRTRLRARPRDRGTDHEAAHAWFRAVVPWGAKCVACGRRRRPLEGHHVIPQQVLRARFPYGVVWRDDGVMTVLRRTDVPEWFPGEYRSLQQLLWDSANGVPLCSGCHEAHTNHSRLVPVFVLPAAAFQFARELGLQHRLGPRFYWQP